MVAIVTFLRLFDSFVEVPPIRLELVPQVLKDVEVSRRLVPALYLLNSAPLRVELDQVRMKGGDEVFTVLDFVAGEILLQTVLKKGLSNVCSLYIREA